MSELCRTAGLNESPLGRITVPATDPVIERIARHP
jgi:hypothetical protein